MALRWATAVAPGRWTWPSATLLRSDSLVALPQQTVRHKGGVKPHRKPRWIGIAPSKMFVIRPKDHTPKEELDQIVELKIRHRDRMAALTQYLWEDYLRNSDVGDAARDEVAREQEEHARRLEDNEMVNAQVAERRELRLIREREEIRAKIKEEVEQQELKELRRIRLADQLVAAEQAELEARIGSSPEELEAAIQQALDNPIDHEFAIDAEGHIYRGRYTKSILVPPVEREKIPVPPTEADRVLEARHLPAAAGSNGRF